QERYRKAAVTAARPEIQPRFAQQRRAAPARAQLEICDRTARDLEVQFTPEGRTRASNPSICYIEPMPEQSIIVWDLETIPDLRAAARMLDLGGAAETEVREALGQGFPKHPLHKIVCIGALVATRQPEGWRVDALGAPHTGERP